MVGERGGRVFLVGHWRADGEGHDGGGDGDRGVGEQVWKGLLEKMLMLPVHADDAHWLLPK